MPNWIPLDDTSNQIGYSGSWTIVRGSTRQWEGGVHSTTQNGASAVLRFKGVGIAFRGTVPAGSGNQVFEYKIDNRAAVRVSTPQRSSDEYAVQLLRVENLPEAIHSITLTNLGNAPFQVDFLEYWPGEGDPNPAPLFPLPVSQPTPNPQPQPQPQPQPLQPQPQPQPQPSPRPSSNTPQPPPQPEPESDPPVSSERTRTIASSETQRITNPTIASTGNSEADNTPSRSLSSSSTSQLPAGPRTISTTDENGAVIVKIIPTATERMITSTDANGLVSTVTIIEAAPSGGSMPVGAIIGIVIGGVIAILALLIFLIFCRRRKRARDALYSAEKQQVGFSTAHDGSAAVHSSTQLISPYPHSPEHAPVSSAPFWRKEPISPLPAGSHPAEHHRQPSSAVSGAGLSTMTGSGQSYIGENVAPVSNEPPPAYQGPPHTPTTEDSLSTVSGLYGMEKH